MTIAPLPALDRTSATFKTDVDMFFGTRIPAFVTEANALETNVNAKEASAVSAAGTATTKAAEASASAATATNKAAEATDIISTALAAPGTRGTSTSSLTIGTGNKSLTIETGKAIVAGMPLVIANTPSPAVNWMWGQVTAYNSGTGALSVNVVSTAGSGTIAAWTISNSPNPATTRPSVVRSERTSNTQLTATDNGKLIDITSGTFTQTFAACASLDVGWYCYLRNRGTGDITLDPDGTETIDGLISFVMYPGEVRLVQCDGSSLRSVVVTPFNKTFTASGSFITPPGYTVFGGIAWSGGSSGEKSGSTSTLSRGGGGGGSADFTIPASKFAASETVVIGAGGAAVTTTAVGNLGGDTSLGSLFTVYGPKINFNSGGSVFSGLVISGGYCTTYEGCSATSAPAKSIWGGTSATSSENSGSSIYGGTAGGSRDASTMALLPGTSIFGGNGGASGSTSSGSNGTAPGGGGGATQTGAQSGAGARGELRIWGIC